MCPFDTWNYFFQVLRTHIIQINRKIFSDGFYILSDSIEGNRQQTKQINKIQYRVDYNESHMKILKQERGMESIKSGKVEFRWAGQKRLHGEGDTKFDQKNERMPWRCAPLLFTIPASCSTKFHNSFHLCITAIISESANFFLL